MSARVYFMRAGSLIKIGTTSGRIDARAAQLQTGCPHVIEVLGAISGGREREARLHRQFFHLHVHGEWFFASDDLLACINLLVDTELSEIKRTKRARLLAECDLLRTQIDYERALAKSADDQIDLLRRVLSTDCPVQGGTLHD